MKTRLLLLLIAAATLCGCDRLGHRLTYYTYINATDKTVVVTLYDQDFYTDDWKVEVNPDAKEVFRFVIAPGEQYMTSIYNRLLLNILYVINQKYGLNL